MFPEQTSDPGKISFHRGNFLPARLYPRPREIASPASWILCPRDNFPVCSITGRTNRPDAAPPPSVFSLDTPDLPIAKAAALSECGGGGLRRGGCSTSMLPGSVSCPRAAASVRSLPIRPYSVATGETAGIWHAAGLLASGCVGRQISGRTQISGRLASPLLWRCPRRSTASAAPGHRHGGQPPRLPAQDVTTFWRIQEPISIEAVCSMESASPPPISAILFGPRTQAR